MTVFNARERLSWRRKQKEQPWLPSWIWIISVTAMSCNRRYPSPSCGGPSPEELGRKASDSAHLGLLVVLQADPVDQAQLGFHSVDVLFFGLESFLQQVSAAVIAYRLAVLDAFAQRRDRVELQLEVALEDFTGVFADQQFAEVLQIGQPLQEQNALDQLIGVLHFVDGFVILVLCQFIQAPVLEHAGVEKVLIDGDELIAEHLVEELDNLGITLHGRPLFEWR